jgi:Coenzyme PQQ synthesis protein D (PqqD)
MSVALTDRVIVHPSVISRELSGELVLLNLESGVYYGLDHVGTRVWQLLLQDKTVGDVCDAMLEEYEVQPDALQGDVSALVRELYEKGLVTRREGLE